MRLIALAGLPEIEPGDDLGTLLAERLHGVEPSLARFDVLVIAQKVVSKAENRFLDLASVTPSARARDLAAATGKDPRLLEAILADSAEVLRAKPGVIIVRHRLGYVMAQAGVDRSNVGGVERVLLLPESPDESAARLRATLARLTGVAPGVVISDSFGRPWRLGTTNVALGAAGVPSLWNRRGERDRNSRPLRHACGGLPRVSAPARAARRREDARPRPAAAPWRLYARRRVHQSPARAPARRCHRPWRRVRAHLGPSRRSD